MMRTTQMSPSASKRSIRGFTLTEMLATVLIMTLVSTLLATGIPVAIDAYRKTVKSANAQVALSTTLTVLRAELGTSSDVRVVGDKIYYLSEEGYWASISNPVEHEGTAYLGLEKQYYAGQPTTNEVNSVAGLGDSIEDMHYPLVSDSLLTPNGRATDSLHLRFSVASRNQRTDPVVINEIVVTDEATTPNELSSVSDYRVLLRFDS